MNSETIDHHTLAHLAAAGAVQAAHVQGQAGGWAVVVRYGMMERPLAAQRSRQVRLFKRLETVVDYLKKIGVNCFDVNAVDHDPASPKTVRRPDRALALKAAHQAAAYNVWLRREVQEAIDDKNPTIAHEKVMKDVRTIIAKARAKRA